MSVQAVQHIGILLFEAVEELDAVGPWEVLAAWTRNNPDDGYAVTTFSRDGDPVACAKGLTIAAHHSYVDVPPLAVLIYPGGRGVMPHLLDERQLDWVRARRHDVPLLTSVCTGSLAYAAAGVLSGRAATTHWSMMDKLTELDRSIDPRPEQRFVDTGDVITASGVSAGIDMALHLVARLAGADRAREVRRYIQYDPQPPV